MQRTSLALRVCLKSALSGSSPPIRLDSAIQPERFRQLPNRLALGICLALAVGILLILVTPVGGKARSLPVHAHGELAAPAAERRVCPSGCIYSSVQAAVDAAQTGDIIKVAAGTYTDIHAYPRRDVVTTGVVTQVVYITKTVTIQGGYTTSNWTTPDPVANPTTLDAQRRGRVLYIAGNISATIAGLRITQGSAAGLGGIPGSYDAGGGVYIITATVILSDNQVVGNVSPTGSGNGGGMYLRYSGTTLRGNTVASNTASYSGGGLFVSFSNATLSDNIITGNTAAYGGGLRLYASPAAFSDNIVAFNTARVYGTALDAYGGGLLLDESDATLVNTVVADNRADTQGSGLGIRGSFPRLLHTTIARNTGGNGSGVYVTDYFGVSSSMVALTNTILVSHTVGISVTGGNTATVNSVLWFGIPTTIAKAITATVTMQNQRQGNPAFAADGYHLTAASAAIDWGMNAGVITDIDGDPRPVGSGYDLGADEFCSARTLVDPVVGGSLTYTDTRGLTTGIQIPPGAVTSTTDILYTVVPSPIEPVSPDLRFAGQAFDLDAYRDGAHLADFTFVKTVTTAIYYLDTDVTGIDEDTLRLYRWVSDTGWQAIGAQSGETQTLDVVHNVLTAWLRRLSRFGQMGASPGYDVFLPLVIKSE